MDPHELGAGREVDAARAADRRLTPAGTRALVWVLVPVVALIGFTQLVLQLTNAGPEHGFSDYYYGVIAFLGALTLLLTGGAVIRRQPGNRIAWMLIALAAAGGTWSLAAEYARIAFASGWPGVAYSAWIARWALVPTMSLFIPIFLLFPDGHVPSPRWRPLYRAWAIAAVVGTVSFALAPRLDVSGAGGESTALIDNPFGLAAGEPVVSGLTVAASVVLLLAAILTGAALVRRFRRARGEERQQIRWLVFVGVAFLLEFMVSLLLFGLLPEQTDQGPLGDWLWGFYGTTLIVGLPAAIAVAVLKYRLYDLDVVIRKAVVVGALAIFITGTYAAVVGGVGALVGTRSSTLSFAAAAILAILFQPARERARHLADRLVYGARATPYEVLTAFSDRVGEAYSTDDVLPRMVQVLAQGTGAATAEVWLRVGDELRVGTAWPAGRRLDPVPMRGAALPDLHGAHRVAVRHQGEILGALAVTMPASDPMNPAKDKLVRDLASQAGLVLRNVRLIEELRASRQRLVAAQDEERRKLERNIHDGAQQQLVALAVQLRLLQGLVDRDAAKARELAERLQAATNDALEDLRDLARGIYPPLLADRGLAAALEAQARKAPVPIAVRSDGVGRYSQDVEAAVYFCSLEALNNIAKYSGASRATVALAHTDGHLSFEVSDDGRGFDPVETGYGTGLRGMADRLDAIGGSLEVQSSPGNGTTVLGRIPAQASEHAP